MKASDSPYDRGIRGGQVKEIGQDPQSTLIVAKLRLDIRFCGAHSLLNGFGWHKLSLRRAV